MEIKVWICKGARFAALVIYEDGLRVGNLRCSKRAAEAIVGALKGGQAYWQDTDTEFELEEEDLE
jgi:hypothetical protein